MSEVEPNPIRTAFNGIQLLLIGICILIAFVIGLLGLVDFIKVTKQFKKQEKALDGPEANSLLIKDLYEVRLSAFYSEPKTKKNEPLNIYAARRMTRIMRNIMSSYIVVLFVHFAIPLMFSLLMLADPDKFTKAESLFTKNNAPNIKVQLPLLIGVLTLFVFTEVYYKSKFEADPSETGDLKRLQSRMYLLQTQNEGLLNQLYDNVSSNSAYNKALLNYLTMGEDTKFFSALLMEKNPLEIRKNVFTYSLLRTYKNQLGHYRPEEYDILEGVFRGDSPFSIAKRNINLIEFFCIANPQITDASEELLTDLIDFKRKTATAQVTSAFDHLEMDADIRLEVGNRVQAFNKQLTKTVTIDYPAIRKPIQKYLLTSGLVNLSVSSGAVAAAIGFAIAPK